MHVTVRKVYYCDFCGKHQLCSITQHETHCTKNPNRQCRMCGRKKSLRVLFRLYKYAVISTKTDQGYSTDVLHPAIEHIEKALYEFTRRTNDGQEGCPACILTILRNTPLGKWPAMMNFNYRQASTEWWHEQNRQATEAEARQEAFFG